MDSLGGTGQSILQADLPLSSKEIYWETVDQGILYYIYRPFKKICKNFTQFKMIKN